MDGYIQGHKTTNLKIAWKMHQKSSPLFQKGTLGPFVVSVVCGSIYILLPSHNFYTIITIYPPGKKHNHFSPFKKISPSTRKTDSKTPVFWAIPIDHILWPNCETSADVFRWPPPGRSGRPPKFPRFGATRRDVPRLMSLRWRKILGVFFKGILDTSNKEGL